MKKQNLLTTVFIVCFSIAFLTSGLFGVGKTLSISTRTQEHSNWCWDASSQCILYYFGKTPTQCAIANFAWNRTTCCSSTVFNWNHVCNQGNYLFGTNGDCQDVLAHWAVSSTGKNSSLTWTEVNTAITNNGPFMMGWYWTGGGGHALVGYGYDLTNNVKYLYYMDPWPGEGLMKATFTYVVSASDHTWGQSLRTK